MEKIIQMTQEFALDAGVRLLGAILLVFVGFKLIRVLLRLLTGGKIWSGIDKSAGSFIISFTSLALKILLLLTAAAVLGVPMTNMVALVGSVGLAVGLSFQGSLSNFAGGLIILIFRPFSVGDYIESSSGNGTVQTITILYTTLRTWDYRRVIIPNGTLSNNPVTNFSAEETRRVDIEYSVSLDTDTDMLRRVLVRLAGRHPLVLEVPEVVVRVLRYTDTAMVVVLRAWCNTDDYWTVLHELTEQSKHEFERESIQIPHPKMDFNINDNKGDNK